MSKELEALKRMAEYRFEERGIERDDGTNFDEDFEIIENGLKHLEAINNANPSDALDCLEEIGFVPLNECCGYPYTRISDEYDEDFKTIKNYILKSQEQEKENELLKEIIKSFFDKGCPLHQYIDKEGILTIEVDSECSIMRLGVYKDADLDKKLKEVLESE